MKNLKIEIPNGYEIDQDKSDLSIGVVAFKKIKSKYPLNVKEIEDKRNFYISDKGVIFETECKDLNNLSTKSRAKAFLALMQLVELRDAWNKIDGFKADWSNSNQYKYIIGFSNNDLYINAYFTSNCLLAFGSTETRNLFLEKFKDLIEEAKELL